MLAKYSKRRSSSKKQCSTFINELCHEFSLDELKKATNNFDENRKIGKVMGDIVYKGYVKYNGENDYPIALLRITDVFRGQGFKNEIEHLCQLCHPNLISFIGFCDQKNKKILVYKKDEMVNGTLQDHLGSRDMESLSWKKRLEICIGAAKGLHYLHTGTKRPIFHRDVIPQNILLDNNMAPKLSQFGLSLQGKLSKSESIPIVVRICEYLQTRTYTDKCDVYSFGMVLLHVILCMNNFLTIYGKMKMLEKRRNEILEPNKRRLEYELDLSNRDDWNLFNPTYFLERFPADEIIDPILTRLISPECLAVFVNIMKRCLNREEPNERPSMGEVEVELEHALALQEEAERETSITFFPPTNGEI
ncbi:probable receptor-like protein kinase At5g38990 isoform X2 [Medicago truncatula]|uniref:probable receptor-like protein kinase At5g38990 isoform X2 n=1 Tax=Medicago truncatula TaxID=3880 RepID=UPI000D2F31CD|nr:probable receptor-like protein kinase At5g38990 isoform X2 [Medicago truncatula]